MDKLHSDARWQAIQHQFLATGDAAPVLAGLSSVIELMTIRAFEASIAALSDPGVALLSMGGYGRRELFPFSDVDVLVLLEHESQTTGIKEALAEFVRMLWDAGLRLSYSVHTVAECVQIHEDNIELSISLLDRRWLAGSAGVHATLEDQFPRFLERQGAELRRRLVRLARARHEKFQGTLFHLEPDIKETPGGLRDLHLIHWLSKLHEPDDKAALPIDRLIAPAAFLHPLRCFLHYRSRRDQNLLNFDAQEALTTQPYVSVREPAGLMREYFRNARVVYAEARRALDESRESSLPENIRGRRSHHSTDEFGVAGDRIYLQSPAQSLQNPPMIFRLLEFVARHGILLTAETERRVEEAADTFAVYCEYTQPLWPALHNILSLPFAAAAIRVMHDTGLLQAMFPELRNIFCLVVRDFYHRYTVDEHTLVAIEKLAELPASKDPAECRIAEILSEVNDLALLRFALLFHDSGKGAHSGDHARLSVQLAHAAMERLQVSPEEQSAVEYLIEHHLDLSAIMSSRDLHDPLTARLVAARIGTLERLKLLTLLTYADISAVNPRAMTPWRLEQLWQIYRVTHQQLLMDLESDRIADLPPGLQNDLPHQVEFIRGFPSRYLRTHSPEEIHVHIELYERSKLSGGAVQLSATAGIHRATIVTRDRPGLFAALAGAISSFRMDILKAEAFSNAQGMVLDTFVFTDPTRTLELNPSESVRLRQTLEDVALGRLNNGQLMHVRPVPRRPRHPVVPPRVHVDPHACATATLIEIIAEDRPLLLYDLSKAISDAGCNIDVVLVDTEGRKAIDVFYVATNGHKLSSNAQDSLSDRLLALCHV